MSIATKRLVSKTKLSKEIIDLCKELKTLLKDSSNEEIYKEISNISMNLIKEVKYVFDVPKIYLPMLYKVLITITSLIYIYIGLMGLMLVVLSEEYRIIGIVLLIVSLIFIYINYVLSKKNNDFIRKIKTFTKYCHYLNYRYFVYIDELNKITGIDTNELLFNIKWAISEGIIPQGHIVSNNHVLIIADAMYGILYEDCQEDSFNCFSIKNFEYDERQKALDLQYEIDEYFQEFNAIGVNNKKILSNIERVKSMVSIVISHIYYNNKTHLELGALLVSFLESNILVVSRYKDAKPHFFKKDDRVLLINAQVMLIEIYDDILRRAYKDIDCNYLNKLKSE